MKLQPLQKAILDHLENGYKLSVCTAAQQFLTGDLRKIISDLRKLGNPIKDDWKVSSTGKRYKIYYIERQLNLEL